MSLAPVWMEILALAENIACKGLFLIWFSRQSECWLCSEEDGARCQIWWRLRRDSIMFFAKTRKKVHLVDILACWNIMNIIVENKWKQFSHFNISIICWLIYIWKRNVKTIWYCWDWSRPDSDKDPWEWAFAFKPVVAAVLKGKLFSILVSALTALKWLVLIQLVEY